MARPRLTDVDDADVHAEGLAREVGHISHIVAPIQYRDKPVEDCGPDTCPGHELWVYRDVVDADNVVNGKVEERYQARDANYSQGLRSKDTENDSCQGGCEQGLIDPKKIAGSTVHIERVCDRREQTGAAVRHAWAYMREFAHALNKVHPDRARNGSICEGIRDIAPVVRKSSLNIVIHASTRSESSPSTPSYCIVVRVGCLRLLSSQVRVARSARSHCAKEEGVIPRRGRKQVVGSMMHRGARSGSGLVLAEDVEGII